MGRFILAEPIRRRIRRAGIGPALFAFCLGIAALQWQASLPALLPLLIGCGVCLGLTSVAARWRGVGAKAADDDSHPPGDGSRALVFQAALLALACTLGFGWAAWRAEIRLADQLPADWERRDIDVIGVIAELPREFERGRRFVFTVDEVMTPEAVVPRRILLSWYAGAHEDQWLADRTLLPGDRWRFTVRLKRPHGHANPGGFDYEAWLLERDLRATGYVRAASPPQRLGSEWSAATAVESLRARLRQHLQKNLADATFGGVIVALALGDQGSIGRDQWDIFAATGTTHLMSISGLHITMMAALFGGLVGWLWRRQPCWMLWRPAQRASVTAGWLAALAYTLLAGAGIPALRTLLMLSVAALAHALDRQLAVSRVLLLALVVVLVFDPWAVLVVGFWLSFAAVAVLLFFTRPHSAAAAPASAGRVPGRLATIGAWLWQWSWAQWAVTLGTLPLVLAFFQVFSLVSPLANALAIPLVGFVIAPLSVAAALLPLPWLATLAHGGLDALMLPLDWLAAQPWALWRQAEPPGWAVGLAVLGVVAYFRWRRVVWRLLALTALGPLLLLPAARPAPGEAWLDLLDVGHGLSVLVRTASHNLLFDAGPRYSPESSAGDRLVLPALRAFGIARLDGLVVSHQDNDHAGGVASVMAALPVGWLASSLPDGHPLRQLATVQQRCARGQAFEWDGVRFRFLSPPADYYERSVMASNRMSCVLRVEAMGRVALLAADAELPEEQEMLAAGEPGPVDVLQVPHQGSRSSSGEAFVAALAPKWALFPVGYRNPYLHPHPEVTERYRRYGAGLLRTDEEGAINVRIGANTVVTTRRQAQPRYWHGR